MCTKIVISCIVLGTGIGLVALGAGLGWGLFPSLVQSGIEKNVVLTNNSEAWDVWSNTPIPLLFKVYFFQVENVKAILKGATPKFKEVGPYVYEQWRSKYDISLNENETLVSYYQNLTFVFNANLSGPGLKETDEIMMYDAAMMGSILTLDMEYPINRNDAQLGAMDAILKKVFSLPNDYAEGPFTAHTVKELLFDGVVLHCKDATRFPVGWIGFCNQIEEMVANGSKTLRREMRPSLNPNEGMVHTGNYLYSFFYAKTELPSDGYYTIHTGTDDSSLLGIIHEWENEPTLGFWKGPECNQILGTDSTIFPPFIKREARIDFFITDLCRSLYATYQRDVEFRNIPGYRYIPPQEQLGSVLEQPDNFCWAGPYSGGMASGLIDLFNCYDAPVVLSFPHFYQAPPEYLENVEGITPAIQDIHETFLEIEPNTGFPLRGSKRAQFNMLMKQVRKVELTKGLKTVLMPLLWVDEGVELDEENAARLKHDVVDVINALEITRWTMIGVGTAGVLVGAGLLLVFWLVA